MSRSIPDRADSAAEGLDADLLVGGAAPVQSELEPGPAPLFDLGSLGERFRRWSGILAAFFSAQVLAQAAGLAAGLVFVRTLPLEQFAFYTLASSILVTLAFVTDLGSSAALLHFFHRSRKEGSDFEPYSAAVVSLRRRLFALGAPVAALMLALWGRERGVDPTTLALAAGVVLGAAWFQITSTIRVLRLRLDDRYGESYRAEIAGALVRLALALTLVAVGWTLATPALATALVAAAVTAFLARGGGVRRWPPREQMTHHRKAIVRYLLPTLPGAAYFAIQGQFVVWLAATFGGTSNLAEVGALARLGLIVGMFSGLSQVVFLPRLVRITDTGLLRARFLQFSVLLALVGLALFGLSTLAPRTFLFLLGPHYSGLHFELRLIVASAAIGLVGGYSVAFNSAMSWTRWQTLATIGWILFQVVLVFLLPLDTTAGAIQFGFYSAIFTTFGQLLTNALGFFRPAWVTWR